MTGFLSPDEIWTCQEDLFIETDKYWAKLHVKDDKKLDHEYYDVKSGYKNSKGTHIHSGYTLGGNRFFDAPKGLLGTISKDVESALYGKLPSEKFVRDVSKNDFQVIVAFTIKGSSRESRVSKFEITERV